MCPSTVGCYINKVSALAKEWVLHKRGDSTGGVFLIIVAIPSSFQITSSEATCLFTRLEEFSLVPAGFLTAQFMQKT